MEQELTLLKQELENQKRAFEDFKLQVQQQTHNGVDGGLVDLRYISNFVETITETSGTTQLDKRKITNPRSFFEQIFIYYNYNGGAPYWRLYIFSDDGTGSNRVWKYTTIA